MKKPIRIAQLTDMHIGENDENVYGSPVRMQFLAVLNELKKHNLDALVLSGDLAANAGEYDSYVWIKEQLKEITCPIYICLGNHDRLHNLQNVFNLNPDDIHNESYYFETRIKEHLCLFLDTSPYFLSEEQLKWIQQQDIENKEEILLFMHHPPLYCGCAFMDEKYPLKNISEAWSVIKELKNINYIFCGHYHTERTIVKDEKIVFLTPSTMVQFDCQTPDITTTHRNPGWRIIEWDGETLRTSVNYRMLFAS
jgi:3',5'-cyclic-AMP phosphodiesterase